MAPGRVVVVGLGPGDPGLITAATHALIDGAGVRFLRTAHHPSAGVVPGAVTFDEVYENAARLDEVYPAIVERLVAAANSAANTAAAARAAGAEGGAVGGPVLYAVPGSPLVAERTVELLRADPRVTVEIHPAMSFLDLAWHRVGVDPVAVGARLLDGQRFATEAAGLTGPLLVSQCDTAVVLSEIKLALAEIEPPPTGLDVTVLWHLGLPEERVWTLGWADLDRAPAWPVPPDHLTTLWIPTLAAPVAGEVARLDELMRVLRARCPWDRRQTHQSLTRHLVEETYEVLEAIDEVGADPEAADAWAHLEEELGDLLFQVVFHATLAAEAGQFTLADVARGIHDKLVARHPHVFGPHVGGSDSPEASGATWEQLKQAEKGRDSAMDGVPAHLPALAYAAKVQSRAAGVGFDWDGVAGAWPKIGEEVAELAAAREAGDPAAVTDELGDLLFSVVNVARHLDVDPEAALRHAAAKFRERFRAVEDLARRRGIDLAATNLAGLDALWDEVKGAGGNPPGDPPMR